MHSTLSEKEKLRQLQRLRDSVEFLNRIDKVLVVGTHDEDGVDFLDLNVVVATNRSLATTTNLTSTSSAITSASTAREIKKQRKKLRPTVDFQTSKAINTLKHVHDAIYEWSLKPHDRHPQFSSIAALELWATRNPQDVIRSDTGLVVVVNNYELPQHEKRINAYLRSARAVPSECLDDWSKCCEGVAHIPSIMANLLQCPLIKTKWYSAGSSCGVGM